MDSLDFKNTKLTSAFTQSFRSRGASIEPVFFEDFPILTSYFLNVFLLSVQ